MRDYAIQVADRVKKGDDRFVTLFFVLLIPVAALLFAATPAALGTQDTLLRFVPAKATVYVHGGGDGADRLVDALVSVPAELRPREAAVFGVAVEDGTTLYGTLLGWGALRGPSEEERRALGMRQAVKLGPATYFLGGDALAAAAQSATTTHTSLSDDKTTARALSVMRSISTLQAWGQSPLSLGTVPNEPFVAGIAPTDLLTTAVIVPSKIAAAYYPFGFRIPSGKTSLTVATSPLAKTVISETRPSFDPIALLLRGLSPISLGTVPYPVQTSFFPNTETGTVSVLLHFPTLTPLKIAPSLERYASTSSPERQPFVMPDNDTAVELTLNINRYHFNPLLGASIPGTLSLTMERPNLQLILAPDGKRGSLLTTNAALLRHGQNPKSKDDSGCPSVKAEGSLILRLPETLLSAQPLVDKVIPFFKGKSIKADSLGDNIVLLCGYHE